jgi:hypothetical protein
LDLKPFLSLEQPLLMKCPPATQVCTEQLAGELRQLNWSSKSVTCSPSQLCNAPVLQPDACQPNMAVETHLSPNMEIQPVFLTHVALHCV